MTASKQPEPGLRENVELISCGLLSEGQVYELINYFTDDKAQAVAEAYKDAVTQIMAAKTEGLFDGPDLFIKRAPIEQACVNLVGYETYKAIQESLPKVDLTKGSH